MLAFDITRTGRICLDVRDFREAETDAGRECRIVDDDAAEEEEVEDCWIVSFGDIVTEEEVSLMIDLEDVISLL